jgi:hypothetical protein
LARDLRTNEDVCPAKPGSTFADRALLEPEYRWSFEDGDRNVKLEYIPL